MDLALTDAARLLGKSERQLRYLIQEGKLPATKHEGRWRLRREDLPLSAGQQRAQEHKRERAAQIALEVLGPQEEQAPSKRRFSVRTLRAYSEAAEVYRDLARDLGTEHPAAMLLHEALMLLACGCHATACRFGDWTSLCGWSIGFRSLLPGSCERVRALTLTPSFPLSQPTPCHPPWRGGGRRWASRVESKFGGLDSTNGTSFSGS